MTRAMTCIKKMIIRKNEVITIPLMHIISNTSICSLSLKTKIMFLVTMIENQSLCNFYILDGWLKFQSKQTDIVNERMTDWQYTYREDVTTVIIVLWLCQQCIISLWYNVYIAPCPYSTMPIMLPPCLGIMSGQNYI